MQGIVNFLSDEEDLLWKIMMRDLLIEFAIIAANIIYSLIKI